MTPYFMVIILKFLEIIYLDSPFNSKADYNVLFKEPSGERSESQLIAFEDTWHWTEQSEWTYDKIMKSAPIKSIGNDKIISQIHRTK